MTAEMSAQPKPPGEPVRVQYFYKVRWGHLDEWLDLFRRNHWPLLREQVREGRMLDVRMYRPRFHGDGHAAWDVLVTIAYRDWAAMEAHSESELVSRLFPDRVQHETEEQRRFELLDSQWDVPLEEVELPS